MSYSSIAWLPLALGLTVLGLVLSYLTYRRRGLRPAMMGTAWSLLPIAAYLTGSIEMLWKIGAAIGQFGSGFVFSPMKWAGIGVTGLAIALFLAAGGHEHSGQRGDTAGRSRHWHVSCSSWCSVAWSGRGSIWRPCPTFDHCLPRDSALLAQLTRPNWAL
jgi:hypothetical protein